MELTIHTYGHIDAMFYILNAIAMIMHSPFGYGIMSTVCSASAAYYGMRVSHANQGNYKLWIGKVIGMIAMVMFMLVPTADMLIYDHVSKKTEKVDRLPMGFALPVGILEGFGDLLAQGFEQAFRVVDPGTMETPGQANYREYGMVFGARLVQEARNWRIKSPEFIENMSSFIDRCVMIDAMIGHYYTPEILLKSDDMWRLVSESAGTLRQVAMRVGKERTLMSCKAAAHDVIEPAFGREISDLEKKYAKNDFGNAGEAKYVVRSFDRLTSNFKKNVELAFGRQVGTRATAEQLFKQQMMRHALKNYNRDEYGFARASATQESNWRIAGDLAGTYLPILMSVLKGLVYSSFIFIIPLFISSGGWSRYLGYITLIASFQLWAPLNAVLNMFIDLYSSASLPEIADRIVSFSNSSRICNYSDKIVAVASGLQMAIPFLSFSIIQGGVGGFIHLAGTITGASQSAAAQAANESVTGNKSFDNYSVGNQQLYNQSGFKTDWNESYAAGSSSYQHMDGAMEKVTGGGNTLIQSGVGFSASSGATAYHLEDSRQGQIMSGIQKQEALINSDQRSLSEAERTTFAKTVDRVANIAQRERQDETFNYEAMGEQGKALQQAVNYTQQLHDKRGYGWEQAAEAGITASAKAGTPFGGIVGSEASITVNGSVVASNSSEQSVGEDILINRDNHTTENYNNIVKAASNQSWAKDTSIDQSQSTAARESYEKQLGLEKQLSIRQESLNNWHQAKSVVDSQGASSSRDMYQEVADGIKQEYGVDAMTAHRLADRRSPEAQKVWQKLQNEDHYVQNLVANISSGKAMVSGDVATQQSDKFMHEHQDRINANPNENELRLGSNDNFDTNAIRNNMLGSEKELKSKFDRINTENAIQYVGVRAQNEKAASNLQARTDKYEEDRIGQGIVSKFAAQIVGDGDTVTANSRIGAPDKGISNE